MFQIAFFSSLQACSFILIFRQPESTSRAGKPSLQALHNAPTVIASRDLSRRGNPLTTENGIAQTLSGCLKKTTVIASIATQCVRNPLTTENGTAQTLSGCLKIIRCVFHSQEITTPLLCNGS